MAKARLDYRPTVQQLIDELLNYPKDAKVCISVDVSPDEKDSTHHLTERAFTCEFFGSQDDTSFDGAVTLLFGGQLNYPVEWIEGGVKKKKGMQR